MKKHLFTSFFLILSAVFFLLPPWLLIVQSLIPPFDALFVSSFSQPLQLFTDNPVLEQYEQLFTRHSDFMNIIIRDMLWCFISSCIQVLLSIVSGYILAKYRNRFTQRTVLFFTLTLVLPMQMFLIPVYRLTEYIGMAGNPVFMYLLIAFSPLGAILMRQVFLKMPNEYIEAFRLEDTHTRHLLRYIVFPTGFPAAGVLFLLTFVEAWSMIEQPLLLISDNRLYPLSMMLYEMRIVEPNTIYAASICTFLPICILLVIVCAFAIRVWILQKTKHLIQAIK